MTWVILAFSFLCIVINYLDRSAISYAITPLQTTFHLSNTDFGLIASAFGIGYLLMTLVGGILVDKFGARKIWSISAILWSISCGLIGLSTGFFTLFLFRSLLGIAEGPGFPAFTRVVADWLPVHKHARALGFGLAAVPFASVIGAPIITYLIINFNWRVMFVLLGAIGCLWGILWYVIFRDDPRQCLRRSSHSGLHNQAANHAQEDNKITWRYLIFDRNLLANNYAFFSFGYLLFFAISWLPGFLEQTYHLQIKTIGLFLVIPWLTATFFVLIGGYLSDYLYQKTHSIRKSRSHLIWICQLLSALCFIPVILFHSVTISLIGISLGIGLGLMPNAAFYAINTQLAYKRAATSLGIMDSSFALAGIMAPFLTGWLANITGNFSAPLLLLVGLTLSAALSIILFQHPDQK